MRRPAGPGPLVVKIGSSSLTASDGTLNPSAVELVARQVAGQWEQGRPTVLVTSGAVAAGLPYLQGRRTDIPAFQVASAVGQGRLMERYTAAFESAGRVVGQVLLTRDVLGERSQYLHARQALERMLAEGVVPVVNENDTVVVDELRFGDNDRLAAIVAHLVGAAMLVILTDTEGLYSADPRFDASARLLAAVRHTDEILDGLAGVGPMGSGGPATKVAAARMAAFSGVPTVITSASDADAISRAVRGDAVGTWVDPQPTALSARRLWIAFGMASSGEISVDAGAANALISGGKSLLTVGVAEVRGRFASGDAVEVAGPDGNLIAKGRVMLSSAHAAAAAGRTSDDEGGVLIHRDDLVVLT